MNTKLCVYTQSCVCLNVTNSCTLDRNRSNLAPSFLNKNIVFYTRRVLWGPVSIIDHIIGLHDLQTLPMDTKLGEYTGTYVCLIAANSYTLTRNRSNFSINNIDPKNIVFYVVVCRVLCGSVTISDFMTSKHYQWTPNLASILVHMYAWMLQTLTL